MHHRLQRIAVLGAPGTGAGELTEQLRTALGPHSEIQVSGQAGPSSVHDFALLMGLDQPLSEPTARRIQEQHDTELRRQLHTLNLPYRVVYGTGPQRLAQALLALGRPSPDQDMRQTREKAQFDLNRGRTLWSCEKCSDPECEHKLLTGLLQSADRQETTRVAE